jgi:hypothetical protein
MPRATTAPRPVSTPCAARRTIDAWYSGKTHDFRGNIQAAMRTDSFPI